MQDARRLKQTFLPEIRPIQCKSNFSPFTLAEIEYKLHPTPEYKPPQDFSFFDKSGACIWGGRVFGGGLYLGEKKDFLAIGVGVGQGEGQGEGVGGGRAS